MKNSLISEIAWLHYVGGISQSRIAKAKGLSTAKVNRYIKKAQNEGYLRISVETADEQKLILGKKICDKYALEFCAVVPTIDSVDSKLSLIAKAGAEFLYSYLKNNPEISIGVGAGRTLDELAKNLPKINRPNISFINLTGEFSGFKKGRSLEIIQRLSERTDGVAYSLCAPMIANSVADKQVLLSQRSAANSFSLLNTTNMNLLGVGQVDTNSSLARFNVLMDTEIEYVRSLGVVADLCGNLINQDGQLVDCDINHRMVSANLDMLENKKNIVFAAGMEKANAMLATLNTGIITGIVIDSYMAEYLVS